MPNKPIQWKRCHPAQEPLKRHKTQQLWVSFACMWTTFLLSISCGSSEMFCVKALASKSSDSVWGRGPERGARRRPAREKVAWLFIESGGSLGSASNVVHVERFGWEGKSRELRRSIQGDPKVPPKFVELRKISVSIFQFPIYNFRFPVTILSLNKTYIIYEHKHT